MTLSMISPLVLVAARCVPGVAAEGDPADRIGPMITALAVAPDGSGWLRGSQDGVVYHSSRDGRDRTIPAGLDHVHALAFSPDGATVAVAGGSPAESGAVELRSWPAGDLLGRLEGHDDVVYDVAWLDGGKFLATAGADRLVRVWEVGTRHQVAALEGHSGPVLAMAASPDGKWFCSGGADGTIRVWESAPWRSVRTLNNHLGPVHGLTFRPAPTEGSPATLASAGGDSTVRVWQPGTGRMVRIVRHPAPVLCIAWDDLGSHLVTGAKDGHLRVVDGDGDAILAEPHLTDGRITALAVPPRNAPLLVGDSRGAVLSWNHEALGFRGSPQ
jgi:WD40 repeat protein